MKTYKMYLLAARFLFIACVTCGIGCKSIKKVNSDKMPHSEVINMVLEHLVSESKKGRKATIIGVPRISGKYYVYDSTSHETTYLSRNFMNTDAIYLNETYKIDYNYKAHSFDINEINYKDNIEGTRKKLHEYQRAVGFTPILSSNSGKMAIFVWYSSGYDIHEAQYSVYNKDGEWSIEFEYYIENPAVWYYNNTNFQGLLDTIKKWRIEEEGY